MAEEGGVSVILLAVFMFIVGRCSCGMAREPSGRVVNRDVLAVFAAVTVCYLVGGLFYDYRYFDLVNIVPFALAGIIMGYKNEQYG